MTASRHPVLLSFNCRSSESGKLAVYEAGEKVPFAITRVFTVSANAGSLRGQHAHRKCTQLLVVQHGGCKVTWTDGTTSESVLLKEPDQGLLIPPGIWASQLYLESPTIVMVLCDRPYEEFDYIRDYKDYLDFVGK